MVGDVTLWKAITGAVVSVLALVGWLWRIDSKAEARTAQLRKDLIVHLDGMDSRAEARMAQLRKDLIARLDVMDSMAEARMAQLRKDLKGHLDSMDSKAVVASKGLTDTVRAATPEAPAPESPKC